MKPKHLIPPILAIALAIVLLTYQRQSIAAEEKKALRLREMIDTRSSDGIASSPSSPGRRDKKAAKKNAAVDWKALAAKLAEMQRGGGMSDMREMMSFQKRVLAMTTEEIIAALDEVAGLDLPQESRDQLEQMLLGPLLTKDPEAALTRFIGRLDENQGMMSWTLSHGLKTWAEKDLGQATAWFDSQISAGTFDSKALDGRSRPRMQFEGALVGVLLSTDPAAAAARLGAIPLDQRSDVVQYFAGNLKEEHHGAYAKLIREQLEGNARIESITRPIASIQDYPKVSAYLDRIAATPEERAAGVESAAESKIQSLSYDRKITPEHIDTMRDWAKTQSPGAVDSATGKSLAATLRSGRNSDFTATADLALRYHEASGNDEVLFSFLKEGYFQGAHKEEARTLAGRISDPKRRGEILERLK